MYMSFTSTLKHNRNIEQVSRSEVNINIFHYIERFDKSTQRSLFVESITSYDSRQQTRSNVDVAAHNPTDNDAPGGANAN